MTAAHPNVLNLMPFVSVDHMIKIVLDVGFETMPKGIAAFTCRSAPHRNNATNCALKVQNVALVHYEKVLWRF